MKYFSFLISLFIITNVSVAQKDWPLGTVITSTLNYDQFSELVNNNGRNASSQAFDASFSNWSPADGRSIEGSDYHETFKFTNVPDMRGQFLRGHNNSNAQGEPSGNINGNFPNEQRNEVNGYSYQKFGTSLKDVNFTTSGQDGQHQHTITGHFFTSPGILAGGGTSAGGADKTFTTKNGEGEHTHAVIPKGGVLSVETRPQNVAVYYYIRIKE
ncbi:hypothetical protein [Cyclobacterium salsum]|uniref:hypothetical protein n=1 Tax=Cyclobacterium salsum TaxID=2666329 RepID=UPI001391933A|nr:hypothetical protein [Cyclobacterium salsum]